MFLACEQMTSLTLSFVYYNFLPNLLSLPAVQFGACQCRLVLAVLLLFTFSATKKWPVTGKLSRGESVIVRLREMVNIERVRWLLFNPSRQGSYHTRSIVFYSSKIEPQISIFCF